MSGRIVKKARPKLAKPKRLMILRKSKAIRMWLLRNPWVRPMCVFNFAAIKIQQHLRGFILRRRLLRAKLRVSQKPAKKKGGNKQLERYLSYMDRCRKQLVRKPVWLDEGFSTWCAVRIQSLWRMHKQYKKRIFRRRLINQVASIIIQTAWRNHLYRTRIAGLNDLRQPVILDVYAAAQMIQMCWRQFCNRRIYRYFRDLITKQLKGAPYDLLRSIIPTESHLLDRASGVHVRFRLGGRVFPPKVYFKIYTHRPLCDVNAFAPRNYAAERPADPAQVLNRSSTLAPRTGTGKAPAQALRVGARYFGAVVKTTSVNGTTDWYRREENNEWRPIASHMFENISAAPWYREAPHATRPRPFHFSKLRRDEELRKARKKRRRQWMVKAYMFATAAAAASGQLPDSFAAEDGAAMAEAKHTNTANATPMQAKYSSGNNSPYPTAQENFNTPASFRYADTKHETASNIIAGYYRQSGAIAGAQVGSSGTGTSTPGTGRGTAAGPGADAKADSKRAAMEFKRSFTDSEADSKSASSGSLLSRRHLLVSGGAQGAPQAGYVQQRPMGTQTQAYLRSASPPTKPKPVASDGIADIVDWSLALNFDEYARGWGAVGTSLPSDAKDCRDRDR